MSFLAVASVLATLFTLSAAQAQTSEQSAALGTDPVFECTPYSLPAVTALQAAGAFPPIWQVANLSKATPSDSALFAALNPSIPNIAPRGTVRLSTAHPPSAILIRSLSSGDGQLHRRQVVRDPLHVRGAAGAQQANDSSERVAVVYDGVVDPDCWWTYKQCTTPKIAGLQADVTRCAEPNSWGFTLDDGPNCSHNAYYDYLQSVNQKATLFYIGSNVLDWPLEAQRGLDDGHEVCAHTWSHRYMTSLTNEQAFAELYYSKKAIKDVLGITVQCWRPPFGDVDDRIRYIAQALGLATVIWADNTFDYTIDTTNKSYVDGQYNAILNKQKAGGYSTVGTIVLSHELNNFTMSESQQYLPKIQAAFAAAPIAVCNNNTNPYLETGYSYPNFQQWVAGTHTLSVASATAVSVDATISLPLKPNQVGSIFVNGPYATGAATVGATNAQTSAASQNTAALPSGSSSSTASSSAKASGATAGVRSGMVGVVVGLSVVLLGVVGGTVLV